MKSDRIKELESLCEDDTCDPLHHQALPECLAEIKRLQGELDAYRPKVCQHDDPSWCTEECLRGHIGILRERARNAEGGYRRGVKDGMKMVAGMMDKTHFVCCADYSDEVRAAAKEIK